MTTLTRDQLHLRRRNVHQLEARGDGIWPFAVVVEFCIPSCRDACRS
jgi:hypothetical protein